MTLIPCKFYGENLLREYFDFQGKIGTWCQSCGDAECLHHGSRNQDEHYALLTTKGEKSEEEMET